MSEKLIGVIAIKLEYEPLYLHLSTPFVSYKGTANILQHMLVRLHWKGEVGYGVVVPAKEYGEEFETVEPALQQYLALLASACPLDISSLFSKLERILPRHNAVLAAIDMALHDLLGKIGGLSLRELLKLESLPLPETAVTIGVMPFEESLTKVNEYADWPIIKLKMINANIELVSEVRRIYKGRLRLDSNGAWPPEEAVSMAKKLYDYDIEFIEQPIAAGFIEDLLYVAKQSPIPIVADEDCVTPLDIQKLNGIYAINIKLLKCGGILKALAMIQRAHALGLKVMLGCKNESAVGVSAIAQLGGYADFLDLDGHLNIMNDPFVGLTINKGVITLPSGHGLGMTLVKKEEK